MTRVAAGLLSGTRCQLLKLFVFSDMCCLQERVVELTQKKLLLANTAKLAWRAVSGQPLMASDGSLTIADDKHCVKALLVLR